MSKYVLSVNPDKYALPIQPPPEREDLSPDDAREALAALQRLNNPRSRSLLNTLLLDANEAQAALVLRLWYACECCEASRRCLRGARVDAMCDKFFAGTRAERLPQECRLTSVPGASLQDKDSLVTSLKAAAFSFLEGRLKARFGSPRGLDEVFAVRENVGRGDDDAALRLSDLSALSFRVSADARVMR